MVEEWERVTTSAEPKNLPRAVRSSKRGSIMFRQHVEGGFFMDMPSDGVLINDKKGEGRYGGGFEPRLICIFPLGAMRFLCNLAPAGMGCLRKEFQVSGSMFYVPSVKCHVSSVKFQGSGG
jgi:hypothetical protein